MPQLIALDLDGTLLSHDGLPGPLNIAALQLARQSGTHIVIATGRRHLYALKVLQTLGLDPDTPLISSNGAVVRTFASTPIEHSLMDPDATRWLLTLLTPYRDALVLTFDRTTPAGDDQPGSLVVEHLANLHSSIGKWMESNAPYIRQVIPIELALAGDPALNTPIQAMLCGTVARMRAAEALMLAHPRIARAGSETAATLITLNRTEYPDRDLSLVDILPARCSKGAAILRLAATLDIPAAEIMAIGDNWNDLSMLEIAGHPVLMGNAPADLLAMARQRNWQIAPPCNDQGVAHILHQFLPSPTPALSS